MKPNFLHARFSLATAYSEKGQKKKAFEVFTEILETVPGHYDAI